MRFERAQPRRSGRSALAVVGLLPILLFGTSPPIRGHPGAPTVGPALVATAQRCGALTASLTLLAVARETAALPAGAVRGLRWRLAIDAPPAPSGGDGGDASLEVFTIRGARAARAERPVLRWTGEGDGFSEGPLAPPPLDGEVRAGDLVRVRATIRTPAAAIALGGLLFTLRATADGFAPADPVALPLTPCGPPPRHVPADHRRPPGVAAVGGLWDRCHVRPIAGVAGSPARAMRLWAFHVTVATERHAPMCAPFVTLCGSSATGPRDATAAQAMRLRLTGRCTRDWGTMLPVHDGSGIPSP